MLFNQLLYLVGCLALSLAAFFFVFVWLAFLKGMVDIFITWFKKGKTHEQTD